MSRGRWLIAAWLFFVDVRVRAEGHVEKSRAGRPPQSLERVVSSTSSKSELVTPPVILDKGGLLEVLDHRSVHLIRGTLYVAGPLTVRTPFAVADCEGECLALVERAPDGVRFKNLAGSWTVRRRGDDQRYGLAVGMMVRVGEVGTDGRSEMDFPVTLPWASTMAQWARMFPGSADKFREAMAVFRSRWRRSVEAASRGHLEIAQRRVAMAEQEASLAERRRQTREREDAEIRADFRRRNFIDP